jgi:hypothetical protein
MGRIGVKAKLYTLQIILAEFDGKGEPEENRFNPKPHFKAFEIGGVQLCLS